MSALAEAKAVEREERENLRDIMEAFIARYPAELQDKVREIFRPTFDRIAAADARDDAVAADVLADVKIDT